MSHIRAKDTKLEIVLRKALWHKGYRYRKNWNKMPGKPDIVLTKYMVRAFMEDMRVKNTRVWKNSFNIVTILNSG